MQTSSCSSPASPRRLCLCSKYLRRPQTAERDQPQLCGPLTKPLVLYNQLVSYGTIVGDWDEAKSNRSQRLDHKQLQLDGDKYADAKMATAITNVNAEETGRGSKQSKRKII